MPDIFSDKSLKASKEQYIIPGYKDLGLVIDAVDVPAGGIARSERILDTGWVRNIMAMVSTDQTYDLTIQRSDSEGTPDAGGLSLTSGQSARTLPNFRSHPGAGSSGLVGGSCVVILKNTSGVKANYAKVKLQLMD